LTKEIKNQPVLEPLAESREILRQSKDFSKYFKIWYGFEGSGCNFQLETGKSQLTDCRVTTKTQGKHISAYRYAINA